MPPYHPSLLPSLAMWEPTEDGFAEIVLEVSGREAGRTVVDISNSKDVAAVCHVWWKTLIRRYC